jgi:hypothetical protein
MTLPLPPKKNQWTKNILAIDPGNIESAYVLYRTGEILEMGLAHNRKMLQIITDFKGGHRGVVPDILVIEQVSSYGKVVGYTIFDTCEWSGRFIERWGQKIAKMPRQQVKKQLGIPLNASDSIVNQYTRARFPATGGGADPKKGTMKEPGPLYGVHDDIWAALAVAIAYDDKINPNRKFMFKG